MPASCGRAIDSPNKDRDAATTHTMESEVTGNDELTGARRRTSIHSPKARSRHESAAQTRGDCATMAIHSGAKRGSSRRWAAALKNSCAAVSAATSAVQSATSSIREAGVWDMGFAALSVIFGAIAFEVMGQVAFKRGATRVAAREAGIFRYWSRMLRDGWVQAGIALYAVELLLWIAALRLAALSVAFPMMALSYCGVAIAGHFWLGERLGRQGRVAVVLITAGAILVTAGQNP